jgi:hypothetical protein
VKVSLFPHCRPADLTSRTWSLFLVFRRDDGPTEVDCFEPTETEDEEIVFELMDKLHAHYCLTSYHRDCLYRTQTVRALVHCLVCLDLPQPGGQGSQAGIDSGVVRALVPAYSSRAKGAAQAIGSVLAQLKRAPHQQPWTNDMLRALALSAITQPRPVVRHRLPVISVNPLTGCTASSAWLSATSRPRSHLGLSCSGWTGRTAALDYLHCHERVATE